MSARTNEGWAEYFEEGRRGDDRAVLQLGHIPDWRLEALHHARRDGAWIPVAKLLTMPHHEWSDTVRRGTSVVQYCEAWLLCHFLIHGDQGRYVGLFDQYLGLLDQGVDGESAFKRVFGEDLSPLDDKLKSYMDGLKASPAVAHRIIVTRRTIWPCVLGLTAPSAEFR